MHSKTPAYDRLKRKSPRYAKVAAEYVRCGSYGPAAAAAGYKGEPGSHQLRARGKEICDRPEVREAIAELAGKQLAAVELSVERVLEEIKHNALVDPADMFAENGELKPLREMPESVRRAIASIEIIEHNGKKTTKVRLNSKTEALTLAGRYFKMFTDKAEVALPGAVTIKIENA